MGTAFAKQVRERIYGYLLAAGAPLPTAGSSDPVRKEWQVSGSSLDGTSASFSDADDVIEFGLLSRVEGQPVNVLHASVVLDEDEASIHCVSATKGDLNFTAKVSPEGKADGLFMAADHFANVVGALAPA